jgi:hypothetical protein
MGDGNIMMLSATVHNRIQSGWHSYHCKTTKQPLRRDSFTGNIQVR